MALKYDGTINAGAILQAGVLLVAATGAVIWTQADLRRLESTQARIEATIGADIVAMGPILDWRMSLMLDALWLRMRGRT